MVADLVVIRPIGMVATVGGTAAFILALPFSIMGGNTGEVWDQLVVEPAQFTFSRPLGHFGPGSYGTMDDLE